MRFWGAHGIAIVATLWLLAVLFEVDPVLVGVVGLPPMVFAVRCFVVEFFYRRGRR